MDTLITVIVAIVVASFSGALGYFLNPVLTHWLRRREREDEREREIHLELREMIEQRLDDCGGAAVAVFRMLVDIGADISPPEAYHRAVVHQRKRTTDQPRHRWEPYRIKDEKLRSLVEQLNEGLLDFESHNLSVPTPNPDDWRNAIIEKERGLREIEHQVRLRLDELRW